MSQHLRQRNVGRGSNSGSVVGNGVSLSSRYLLDASPSFEGIVLKLHVPFLYTIFPTCLQRVLASRWLARLHFAPRWEERHLILLGNYVYRFSNSKEQPKGAPVPVDVASSHAVVQGGEWDGIHYGMEFVLDSLPPGYDSVFALSTFGKTQYFAVSSKLECTTWINSLQEARQAAITRSMGHAAHVPYPKSWENFDRLGGNLLRKKERIKKRMAESDMKQMEMSTGDVAGSLPRGYFG